MIGGMMQTVRTRDENLAKNLAQGVVAIGNFDGVHKGHRHVLSRARNLARENDVAFGVMSFEPHPRAFFSGGKAFFRLTPEVTKLRLFEHLGADFSAILSFDAAFSATSAEDFLQNLVKDWLRASHVVVGFDFHFGHKRAGTPEFLTRWGAQNGLGTTVVPALLDHETPVSSSRIRAALGEGDIKTANALLGYRWFVTSEVIHGAKRGRTLGYPTANMALGEETNLATGVYAVRVEVEGKLYGGAASFGRRPQFDNGAVLLETYLFNFSGDLYGKEISVEFVARLRGEERFESVEALISQMQDDCAAAKVLIGSDGVPSILEGQMPHDG